MHDQPTAIPYGYCYCGCGQKTKLATATQARDGHVKGQPVRFLKGHNHRKRTELQLVPGPLATPCLVPNRAVSSNGYVPLRRGKGSHQGHRKAYEAVYGPIPPGLVIDHLCRNRACWNVEHLEAVTSAENTRRGKSPLTWADVDAIRSLASQGWLQRDIAAAFGVALPTVAGIVQRRHWIRP